MAGTRSQASSASSSPKKEEGTVAGSKRKADTTSSPDSKREAKAPKKQTTIEETIGGGGEDKDVPSDSEMKDAPKEDIDQPTAVDENELNKKKSMSTKDEESDDTSKAQGNGTTIKKSSKREEKMPSSILEKGIIYFFKRNRVGIEEAESVGDIQRSYFVLRPIPDATKLGDGALPDLENNRLLALPKKSFPKSHNERYMAFVEKAPTTIKDLKDNFFKGADYDTKTMGTRHTQSIDTVGEGVYMITRKDDRSTHLVYALTIPSELGEVQEDLGLRSQGSFVISVKNPEKPGPANASLPEKAKFPKEIIEEFRGLAWPTLKPEYLDYHNCQILLIGEKVGSATEPTTKDKKHKKETPKEELDQLEHEDELRVSHLHGDDSIFDDLNISKKEHSQVPTTW